jgi:hypothetical protein
MLPFAFPVVLILLSSLVANDGICRLLCEKGPGFLPALFVARN